MSRIVASLLFLIIAAGLNAQTRYVFEVGKTFKGDQKSSIELVQDIQGSQMTMDTRFDVIYDMRIEEVNGETARIAVSYGYMAMNMDMNMMGNEMTIFVDSEDPPEMPEMNETHALFKDLTDIPFYFTMKGSGEIVELEGMEVFEERMRATATDPNTVAMLDNALNPDKLKSDFSRFFMQFPESNIDEGSSWDNLVSIPDLNLVDATQRWTVNAINQEENLMEFTGIISSIRMNQNENGVKMELSGDLSTMVKADLKTGWPNKITVFSDLNGEASTSNPDLGNISWPVHMKVESITQFTSN